MNFFNRSAFVLALILFSPSSFAAASDMTVEEAKEAAKESKSGELTSLGFGPAFYYIKYNDKILSDSTDVRLRGDGTITASRSDQLVQFGLELHYDFSFGNKLKCKKAGCRDPESYDLAIGHRISPFIGVFDIEDGVNGIAVGVLYGYSKGTKDAKTKKSLNVGIGWISHKSQIVLADDVKVGNTPPAGLNVEDYTERKDVDGVTLMISANIGY